MEWGISGGAGAMDEEQERELVLDLIQSRVLKAIDDINM